MEHLYNYSRPIHIKEVKGTLKEMVEEDKLEELKEYFVLKGRGNITETRKTRKFIAEKYWSRTKLYGHYMRTVPFVKMVAICNNLSYDNPSEQSDIDLLIVIKPGRMWLARLIITLTLHFFGVRRHGKHTVGRFCLSFFITTNHLNMEKLQIKPEDPYLAYWTKLLTPIYGEKTYEDFKEENEKWLTEKYGLKLTDNKKHLYVESESKLKKFFEWVLNGCIGNALENMLKKTFKKRTLRKMKHLGPEASIIVNDDILKFHNHDKRKDYYDKWIKF